MAMYTYSLFHRGSLRVGQAEGPTFRRALKQFVRELEGIEFGKKGQRRELSRRELWAELQANWPTGLNGLDNVAGASLKLADEPALLVVVRTDPDDGDDEEPENQEALAFV